MYDTCYRTEFDGFDVIVGTFQLYYAVFCIVKGGFAGVQLNTWNGYFLKFDHK